MKGGLVDPEAGLAPEVEIPNGLGGRLERDVGDVLMSTTLAAATFGQGPTHLEAMTVRNARVAGDLHTRREVHVDGDTGHGSSRFNPRARMREVVSAASEGKMVG
jgi:hypothetical protein